MSRAVRHRIEAVIAHWRCVELVVIVAIANSTSTILVDPQAHPVIFFVIFIPHRGDDLHGPVLNTGDLET